MAKRLFPQLNEEQERTVIANVETYRGVGTTLEAALGALILGQHFGWRVLKILHNPGTYKKYEEILGIQFSDVCPETTEHSKRNVGYDAAAKLKSFWAVVTGKQKIDRKGYIEDQEPPEENA